MFFIFNHFLNITSDLLINMIGTSTAEKIKLEKLCHISQVCRETKEIGKQVGQVVGDV